MLDLTWILLRKYVTATDGNLLRLRLTGMQKIWNSIPERLIVSGTDLRSMAVKKIIHGQNRM